MDYNCLPDIRNKGLVPSYFPTLMQAFIFRNWNMITKEKLADVLHTTVYNVELEAKRMGLEKQGDVSVWKEKGYITIIRANWHLLPYEQLLQLLDWTEEKLALVLKEEDFLNIKLGNFKPHCERVTYCKLTAQEEKETERIKAAMQELSKKTPSDSKSPFDFWNQKEDFVIRQTASLGQVVIDEKWKIVNLTGSETVEIMLHRFSTTMQKMWNVNFSGNNAILELSYIAEKQEEYHEIIVATDKIEIKAGGSSGILRGLYRLEDLAKLSGGPFYDIGKTVREPRFGARYIYSFCGLYEQALDVDSRTYCPDSLLEQYARAGINGIWIQGVLYRLTKFPYEPKYSTGWEKRQANLKDFAKRAKEYGIKIYLYLNEPRTMPVSFFEKHGDMMGSVSGQYACMCTSSEKTLKYLNDAVKSLCTAVPDLGGFFTITMSENLTHCKARKDIDVSCPRCAERKPWELVAEVNRTITEAAHSVNPDFMVIAWDWGWVKKFDFEQGDIEKCLHAMPDDIAIMCKREAEIPFVRGGVSGQVADYSISVEGLSQQSVKTWEKAIDSGHEIVAKIQANNTWECSTTPYLPVFRTLFKQIESLIEKKVGHLMLSWTLGGYPSPNIRLLSEMFFVENGDTTLNFDSVMQKVYGDKSEQIKLATDTFCDAFSEFPFHLDVLYFGPQNGGVANPLYLAPTGYQATMTCYCYDDLETWRSIYPAEVLESQFKKVSDIWEKGLSCLSDDLQELKDIAFISYSLFKASYNQIRFVRLRDNYHQSNNHEVLSVIKEERALAIEVYKIMCRHPEVGFEAANHYYYNIDSICEKIINCDWLLTNYQ